MVFDHTLLNPPDPNYGLFIQNIFDIFFSLIWVSNHSKWILVRKQTLENMLKANCKTPTIISVTLSPGLAPSAPGPMLPTCSNRSPAQGGPPLL